MSTPASFVRPFAAVQAVSPVAAGRPPSAEQAAEGDQAFAKLLEQQRNAPRPPQPPPQTQAQTQALPPPPVAAASSEPAAAERPPQAAPIDEPQPTDKDEAAPKDPGATTKKAAGPTRQAPLLPGGLHPAAPAKRPTTVEGDAGPAPVCGPAPDGSEGAAVDTIDTLTPAEAGLPPPNHAEMPTLPPPVALTLPAAGDRPQAADGTGLAAGQAGSVRAHAKLRDAAGGPADAAAGTAAAASAADAATAAAAAAAAAKAELQETLASVAKGSSRSDGPGRSDAPAAPVGTRLPPDTAIALGGTAASSFGSTAAPSLAGPSATGATAEAPLPARPGAPDFAPQLGAQISTWVRAGVQEARLQLNPAEMGPVMVKIELDGAAAQVSFSAAHAETRLALEAAMPALAYSLSENGLTLAGGGVFEQAPQREQAGDRQADGPPRRPAGGEPAGPPAPARSARTRGVVDLVA